MAVAAPAGEEISAGKPAPKGGRPDDHCRSGGNPPTSCRKDAPLREGTDRSEEVAYTVCPMMKSSPKRLHRELVKLSTISNGSIYHQRSARRFGFRIDILILIWSISLAVISGKKFFFSTSPVFQKIVILSATHVH